MVEETLPAAIKRLRIYVYTLPLAKQLNMLSNEQREAMINLCDSVSEAQANILRYAASDSTDEQAKALEAGIVQLRLVNEAIVIASQHDLLGPADVAHLSALAEHIKERLQ